jgi:hypothetical protein
MLSKEAVGGTSDIVFSLIHFQYTTGDDMVVAFILLFRSMLKICIFFVRHISTFGTQEVPAYKVIHKFFVCVLCCTALIYIYYLYGEIDR